MITVQGVTYGTAHDITTQLGTDITPTNLRDWKRRGLITAHRIGRTNWYPLAECVEAEYATRDRTKPRRGVAQPATTTNPA